MNRFFQAFVHLLEMSNAFPLKEMMTGSQIWVCSLGAPEVVGLLVELTSVQKVGNF